MSDKAETTLQELCSHVDERIAQVERHIRNVTEFDNQDDGWEDVDSSDSDNGQEVSEVTGSFWMLSYLECLYGNPQKKIAIFQLNWVGTMTQFFIPNSL